MIDAEIPQAWPLLLTRQQLRAYLGGICDATLRKICPVAPVDLGANVVRYRRDQIDAWSNTLRPRLRPMEGDAQDCPAAANEAGHAPGGMTAAEKARARAEGGRGWKRSATSSASRKAG